MMIEKSYGMSPLSESIVIPTPKASNSENKVVKDSKIELIIKKCDPLFESYFIFLNPFRAIKAGKEHLFDFSKPGYDTWARKENILNNTIAYSWKSFMEVSGIDSYLSLANYLDFYNSGEGKTYASVHAKFDKALAKMPKLIPPLERDDFIDTQFIKYLKEQGIKEVYSYWDIIHIIDATKDDKHVISIDEACEMVTTTLDKSLSLRWVNESSYGIIMGKDQVITELIHASNLEGFYCSNQTSYRWTLADIPNSDLLEAFE